MLRALKNDIIALEYPINQFISECIRNGEVPYWFNTWGMGFPLQSNLSWGIYSSPQLFFSAAFDYNIYILHIEFIFFILLSGWSMFYLLKKHFIKDEPTAQLLAICYMLSGFMVGSTQWLLYITAAAFTPVIVAAFLSLHKKPSAGNAFQAAVCYTLMFTSVYAAFNIIATYGLAALVLGWLWIHRKEGQQNRLLARHLLLTLLITFLLCFPCLFFTMELLGHLDRGSSIATDPSFFNSNYLHPGALSSLFFPFSSVKMAYANTEGTMLNTYFGLFTLLTLPAAVWAAVTSRNKTAWVLLIAALAALLVSFGNFTPLRQALNILPGFSYFRNPAIFRFYFIFLLLLFMASILKDKKAEDLLKHQLTRYSILLGGVIFLAVLIFSASSVNDFSLSSVSGLINSTSYTGALFISSLVQVLLLLFLLLLTLKKKWRWAQCILAGDMIINTLLCTPFFSVSSYTTAEVNQLLKKTGGFPVQTELPARVPTSLTDSKGNTWQNLNVFAKKVSSNEGYPGPLVLKSKEQPGRVNIDQPLVYSEADSTKSAVDILVQRPGHIRARVRSAVPGLVTLLQNYYPGWKVYVNDKEAEFITKGRPGLSVNIPAGESRVVFRYDRKEAGISALLVHLAVLGLGLIKLRSLIHAKRIRSSSPS